MKKNYGIIFLALFLVLSFFPAKEVRAQDNVLLVEWEDDNGEVIVNALRDVIANDTLRPANRIYKLKYGGFYWITDRITNNDFPLVIEGQTEEEAAAEDVEFGPAIIQRVARNDGSDPDGVMFEAYDNLTVRNVWIMGQTDQGVIAAYEPIKLLGDTKRYVFDNVIFDRNDWHHLGPDGPNNSIYIINCKFRNIFGLTQNWEGLGIRVEVGADTVVIENSTFLNIGFAPFQSEAAPVNYFRFNHNTLVNIGRQFSAGILWKTAYVTNNVFINPYWKGDSEEMVTDPDREELYNGFFGIGALPARFGTDYDRKIVLANNSFWRDQRFEDFYTQHQPPIQPQPFVNDTTTGYFAAWGGMLMQNNYLNVNPEVVTYPDEKIDSMFLHITQVYAEAPTPFAAYYFDPGRDEECFVCNNWPLPEDFSYSNSTLLTGSTDGLPVGDLNWFPTSKENFEANKDTYIAALENMVTTPELEIVNNLEAENGTLAGDAEVVAPEGFIYFQMDGSGWIQWDFNLETETQIDLNVWTHMRGNGQRGQRIIVNGVSIHDPMGWGEYIWGGDGNIHSDMPIDEWTWTLIIQAEILEADALTLPAGPNTIRIEPSWGYQNFAGIQIIEAGTQNIIKDLPAVQASYEGVAPVAEGIPWVPSEFKAVNLGAGSSVSWNVDVATAGDYMLRIFYATDAEVTGEVSANGTVVDPSVAFSDTADVFTEIFTLPNGANTIMLSSAQGGVVVDYVQLISYTSTGLEDDTKLPEGYSLSQNYPNPFNPTTKINFSLGKASNVKLIVYNILGQKVATLVNGFMPSGAHQIHFDAKLLSSGVYFYGLETADFTYYKKMMLLK